LNELAEFKKEIIGDEASQFRDFLNNRAEKEIFEGLRNEKSFA